MQLPLEDTWEDVLGKAQRGLGLEEISCAPFYQLTDPSQKISWLDQQARRLGLNSASFQYLALGKGRPTGLMPQNVLLFKSPFRESTVNSYLFVDEMNQSAIAIDTGTDASEMLKTIHERGLTLEALFLTHGDGDHIFEMDRIVEKTKAPVFIGKGESAEGAETFEAGKIFEFENFDLQTRLTCGHTVGGITYITKSTIPAIAFVGDALFASSMGGAPRAYQQALKTNREVIFSLPENTVLFPGHGPITTVALEKKYNPFFVG